jgi:hypothetical protein
MKHETLAAALIAARAEFPPIPKDSTNPHFKSKFASLDAILGAVVPVLSAHGLILVQPIRGRSIETTILHESGEMLASSYPLPENLDDPQKLGAAVTYGRRYSASSLLGITADEDDDGNAASAPRQSRQKPREAPQEPQGERGAAHAYAEQVEASLEVKKNRAKATLLFWMKLKENFGEVAPWITEKNEDATGADIANAHFKRLAIHGTFGTKDVKAVKVMRDDQFLQFFNDNFESALDVAIKAKKEHDADAAEVM